MLSALPCRAFFSQDALAIFWTRPVLGTLVFHVGLYRGVCLFVPDIADPIGAALFGPIGDSYTYGSVPWEERACFLDRSNPGRDFAASLIGEKLKKYDEALNGTDSRRPILATGLFSFYPMNFGMGLTRVQFWITLPGPPWDFGGNLHLYLFHRQP